MRTIALALTAVLLSCGAFGCESTPRENQFTQAVETSGAHGVLLPEHRVERLPWSSPYGEPFAWRKRVEPLPWSTKQPLATYEKVRATVPPPYAATGKASVTE